MPNQQWKCTIVVIANQLLPDINIGATLIHAFEQFCVDCAEVLARRNNLAEYCRIE